MPLSLHADLFSVLPRVPHEPIPGARRIRVPLGKLRLIRHAAPPSPLPSPAIAGEGDARLAALRQVVARLERASLGAAPSFLSLGLPELHRHLPGAGLPCGALHEVMAAAYGDRAAALGFLVALMAVASRTRRGATLLVLPRGGIADFGNLYGHGLARMGLDPGRLLLVETRRPKDACWAMEEALRSNAGLAAVAGAIEAQPDLTMSRRLNLAADDAGTPLLLLRPPTAAGLTAALTRWRIAAGPAARDRFGAFASCRWSVTLERCRNGRPGQWRLEWDHVTHCFRLAEGLADRALPESAGRRHAG
jgi:protein ImuA